MPVSTAPGRLYVVATPIGNLGDISERAAAVLGEVDLVAAEDTRHTRRLLAHLGHQTPLISLHEHNERERSAGLVAKIAAGKTVALVSDAGTPLVSDPGYRLVRAARAAGLEVLAVPGPCAAIAALSVAGLPSDRFVFEGFLPARQGQRQRRLARLANEMRTMVFYVPPRQLRQQLQDAISVFGDARDAALARELTKLHEAFYAGSLGELADRVEREDHLDRGELVLCVAGSEADCNESDSVADALLGDLLGAGLALRRAVAIAAKHTGLPRNTLYRRALQMKNENTAD